MPSCVHDTSFYMLELTHGREEALAAICWGNLMLRQQSAHAERVMLRYGTTTWLSLHTVQIYF